MTVDPEDSCLPSMVYSLAQRRAKRGRAETDPLRIINYRTDPVCLWGGGIAEGFDVGFVFLAAGGFLVPDVLGLADEMDRDVAILPGYAVGVGFLPGQPGQGGQQVDADRGNANVSIQETGVRRRTEVNWISRRSGFLVEQREQFFEVGLQVHRVVSGGVRRRQGGRQGAAGANGGDQAGRPRDPGGDGG